jgi:hypothetical protein
MVGKKKHSKPKGFANSKSFISKTNGISIKTFSRRTNSPQAGNEGDFGNINVSPNDQSLYSQANHDVASDLVVPGLVADHFENDNKDVTVQLAQPDFESMDPYSVLGVSQHSTNLQIKKTFHKLSKQYHPDRLTLLPNQQDAHNIFTLISNAYEFLMDPDKKGNMI